MIKGSEIRKADFPIEPLLLDGWSPRALSGEEISREELMRLFEAARWAPSSLPGSKESLPEELQARESPNDRRKVSESIFEGPFKLLR